MEISAGTSIKARETIPFEYEKISGDEYKRRKGSDYLVDSWQRVDLVKSDDLAPALYECLIDIEYKLNLIIRHLSLQKEGKRVIPHERDVEINSFGATFEADELLNIGDILMLKMILPLYPISYLTLFADVTDVETLQNRRSRVSIRYLDLNTETKDKIISFLFKKQREAIRNEKR